MIYSHKPQRSGKSIPTNTNTPPQDPPPPPEIPVNEIPNVVEIPVEIIPEIPDVFIEDSTPPVMDAIIEVPEIVKPIKITEKFVEFSVSSASPEPPTPTPIKIKSVPKITPKTIPQIPVIETPIHQPQIKPKVSLLRRILCKLFFWRRN